MTAIRRFKMFAALGVLAAFVLPAAAAHWASPQVPNVTPTHAHFVAGGLSTDVGYFGQRLCQNTANGDIVWSGPDGTCPLGTVAFIPPARGLGLGTGDCEDLTIDPANYVIQTPHNVVYPDDVVLDSGDADDYYMSESQQTAPAHLGGIGAGSYEGPGNGLAGGLGQANAANRIIWYNDLDGAAGTQATLTEISGNDEVDGSTSYFPAPGAPYTTLRANRQGSTSTAVDFTDHDPETGIGIACFTYAIDNGPNGRGSDGLAQGFAAAPLPWGDYPGDADGCQGLAPTAVGICQNGAAAPIWCGAGYHLNDPAHPLATVSLTLTPEGPGFGPSPIGNDGVFDTTLASTAAGPPPLPAGTFVGCPGGGTAGTLRGTGAGVGAGQVNKGVKLHALGWPLVDISAGGLLKIGYSVCHDVADTGCTNIPIEDSQSGIGIPCGPGGPAPAPANVGSGCYGHVASRLNDCVYNPQTQAAGKRTNPGSLGPIGLLDTPDFFGQASRWGSKLPKNQPCWPESLYWNPLTNTWTPASEPGALGPGFAGDIMPATGDAVEGITAFISTADLGLMRGLVLCDPGSVALPGGNPPPSCQQTPGTAPQLPAPELGSWTAGWAAVFL